MIYSFLYWTHLTGYICMSYCSHLFKTVFPFHYWFSQSLFNCIRATIFSFTSIGTHVADNFMLVQYGSYTHISIPSFKTYFEIVINKTRICCPAQMYLKIDIFRIVQCKSLQIHLNLFSFQWLILPQQNFLLDDHKS